MSKRKGLSVDDKRKRLLEIFHERKEVFQLKELEKIAPKEKGIVVQSVKDVLQSLVDDGLVDTDKIGTSVYYWSFPSKAFQNKKVKLDILKNQNLKLRVKLDTLSEKLKKSKEEEKDESNRDEILEENKQLKEEKLRLEIELKKYEESDPDLHKKKQEDSKVAKEAANRWTDNIFSVKSWCKKKFAIEEQVLNKQFGIPSDLDYLD